MIHVEPDMTVGDFAESLEVGVPTTIEVDGDRYVVERKPDYVIPDELRELLDPEDDRHA